MREKSARGLLTWLGVQAARPQAYFVVLLFTAGWLILEPNTLDWHGVATLATWLMTLFIQRAEHRDTQAIHAKLDALVGATDGANNELQRVDEDEPEEIEDRRKRPG